MMTSPKSQPLATPNGRETGFPHILPYEKWQKGQFFQHCDVMDDVTKLKSREWMEKKRVTHVYDVISGL